MAAGKPAAKRLLVRLLSPGSVLGILVGIAVVAWSVSFVLRTQAAEPVKVEAVTMSGIGVAERPVDARGLTGRVVGDDGVDVRFAANGVVYTLHHLAPDRVSELVANGGHLQHIARSPEGRLSISDLGATHRP